MSEQPQRPTTDDRDAWRASWQAQGMPWRTDPSHQASSEASTLSAMRKAAAR
jgi:hypothetical protein